MIGANPFLQQILQKVNRGWYIIWNTVLTNFLLFFCIIIRHVKFCNGRLDELVVEAPLTWISGGTTLLASQYNFLKNDSPDLRLSLLLSPLFHRSAETKFTSPKQDEPTVTCGFPKIQPVFKNLNKIQPVSRNLGSRVLIILCQLLSDLHSIQTPPSQLWSIMSINTIKKHP